MSEQSGHGAGDAAREMREHEREARERDADERDPASRARRGVDAGAAKPAPPEGSSTGELGGGT
jgi:hypothetical protein